MKQYIMMRARLRAWLPRVCDYGRCSKWVAAGLKETRFAQMAVAAIKMVVRQNDDYRPGLRVQECVQVNVNAG